MPSEKVKRGEQIEEMTAAQDLINHATEKAKSTEGYVEGGSDALVIQAIAALSDKELRKIVSPNKKPTAAIVRLEKYVKHYHDAAKTTSNDVYIGASDHYSRLADFAGRVVRILDGVE